MSADKLASYPVVCGCPALSTFGNQGGFAVEDLSKRSAQEVLDDHLNLTEHFGAEENWERIVEEDIILIVSE